MKHLERKLKEYSDYNELLYVEVKENGNSKKSDEMISSLRIMAQMIQQEIALLK